MKIKSQANKKLVKMYIDEMLIGNSVIINLYI